MTAARNLLRLVVATALAASLTSCDDGGGGGPQRIHYSMSNYEGCVEAELELNVSTGGSVLSRLDDGSADCTLHPELAARGCELEIFEGADVLSAQIRGCFVGSITKLFSCLYEHADLATLNEDDAASCFCLARPDACYFHGVCDVCASSSDDRKGCEDCDNDADDDLDGEVDCDDPDCELTMDCGFGRTTITCQDSTTTTVSTTSTTEGFAVGISLAPPFGLRD